MDTKLPGLLGKGAVHKTDHSYVNGPGEVLQQHMNMGLGAAGVASADEMDNFHALPPKKDL